MADPHREPLLVVRTRREHGHGLGPYCVALRQRAGVLPLRTARRRARAERDEAEEERSPYQGISSTRPKARRLSMYRCASAASASGNVRSITTSSSPDAQ